MNNSEIFFYPGQIAAEFALSLFALAARQIDPGLFWLISLVLAVMFWGTTLRIAVALIKKAFGFHQRSTR